MKASIVRRMQDHKDVALNFFGSIGALEGFTFGAIVFLIMNLVTYSPMHGLTIGTVGLSAFVSRDLNFSRSHIFLLSLLSLQIMWDIQLLSFNAANNLVTIQNLIIVTGQCLICSLFFGFLLLDFVINPCKNTRRLIFSEGNSLLCSALERRQIIAGLLGAHVAFGICLGILRQYGLIAINGLLCISLLAIRVAPSRANTFYFLHFYLTLCCIGLLAVLSALTPVFDSKRWGTNKALMLAFQLILLISELIAFSWIFFSFRQPKSPELMLVSQVIEKEFKKKGKTESNESDSYSRDIFDSLQPVENRDSGYIDNRNTKLESDYKLLFCSLEENGCGHLEKEEKAKSHLRLIPGSVDNGANINQQKQFIEWKKKIPLKSAIIPTRKKESKINKKLKKQKNSFGNMSKSKIISKPLNSLKTWDFEAQKIALPLKIESTAFLSSISNHKYRRCTRNSCDVSQIFSNCSKFGWQQKIALKPMILVKLDQDCKEKYFKNPVKIRTTEDINSGKKRRIKRTVTQSRKLCPKSLIMREIMISEVLKSSQNLSFFCGNLDLFGVAINLESQVLDEANLKLSYDLYMKGLKYIYNAGPKLRDEQDCYIHWPLASSINDAPTLQYRKLLSFGLRDKVSQILLAEEKNDQRDACYSNNVTKYYTTESSAMEVPQVEQDFEIVRFQTYNRRVSSQRGQHIHENKATKILDEAYISEVPSSDYATSLFEKEGTPELHSGSLFAKKLTKRSSSNEVVAGAGEGSLREGFSNKIFKFYELAQQTLIGQSVQDKSKIKPIPSHDALTAASKHNLTEVNDNEEIRRETSASSEDFVAVDFTYSIEDFSVQDDISPRTFYGLRDSLEERCADAAPVEKNLDTTTHKSSKHASMGRQIGSIPSILPKFLSWREYSMKFSYKNESESNSSIVSNGSIEDSSRVSNMRHSSHQAEFTCLPLGDNLSCGKVGNSYNARATLSHKSMDSSVILEDSASTTKLLDDQNKVQGYFQHRAYSGVRNNEGAELESHEVSPTPGHREDTICDATLYTPTMRSAESRINYEPKSETCRPMHGEYFPETRYAPPDSLCPPEHNGRTVVINMPENIIHLDDLQQRAQRNTRELYSRSFIHVENPETAFSLMNVKRAKELLWEGISSFKTSVERSGQFFLDPLFWASASDSTRDVS